MAEDVREVEEVVEETAEAVADTATETVAEAVAEAPVENAKKTTNKTKAKKVSIIDLMRDKEFENSRKKTAGIIKNFLLGLFRVIVLIGISYVILGPIIGMVSKSFFSDDDAYSPLVFLIPMQPTFEKYRVSVGSMFYWETLRNTAVYVLGLMAIQVFICSMVGYGFARYEFPFKKLLFGCVVIMIVIPINTIMFPLYVTFMNFGPLGNILKSPLPIVFMSALGTGLRSGLYIYIFNQFFRGLPKEIEEAAFVDGAGMWRTYFSIMLRNSLSAVVTVAIFSLVWQYNDTFYASLFGVSSKIVLSKGISSLVANISNALRITDPTILNLYLYAGIVMVVLPVIILYVLLQKQFVEGVERSGIVG